MKQKKAFTLIELVVVMAIIAVLTLLIVAAIQAARRASIETQRKGNVKTVETALEARYSKCGAYVGNQTGVTGTCTTITASPANFTTLVANLNTEGFLNSSQISIDDGTKYSATLAAGAFTITTQDNSNNTIYTALR